jgi:hypothetical protein
LKLTDKQYVLATIFVVCLTILLNAIINKSLIDALYLTFIAIMAIRLLLLKNKESDKN